MSQRRRAAVRAAALGVAAVSATGLVGLALRGRAVGAVSYARDVQPIFDRSCTSCHPSSFPPLDLRRGRSYLQLVRIPSTTNPAFERVLPGNPRLSYLLTHPPDPSNARLLTRAERRIIASWILEGAPNN